MSEQFAGPGRGMGGGGIALHLSSRELALYVIGALGPERNDVVEGHVLECEACAAGLAREAQLEAALEHVAFRAEARRMAAERAVADVVPIRAIGRRAESARPSAEAAGPVLSPPVGAPLMGAEAARVEARVHLVVGGRRTRWAGGVGGALAAAAALVLAFASTTAHSEPAGVAQRAPTLHDAAGDMSGAFGTIEAAAADSLDGG